MSEFQVSLIQSQVGPNLIENHQKTLKLALDAIKGGAQIICTQELYKSYYFCQTEDHKYFDYAEALDSSSLSDWQELARSNGVVLVVSIFEKRAQGLYHNTCVVFDADGTVCGKYRKTHIPDDPQFMEKFYFTPGDLGYPVFKTKFGTIGVLICWDQWFPEAARIVSLQGAQIIFYPTAIGWLPEEKEEFGSSQVESWLTIQRSHAIANGCYIAAANRVGFEKIDGTQGIDFWGNSFVCDPSGKLISEGSQQDDCVVSALVDTKLIEFSRTHWPFLRDRRIDEYAPLLKRYID